MQKILDKSKVGVVVMAYNRPSHLQRLLISLQKSKIKKINVYLDKPVNKLSDINQKEIERMLKAANFWLNCKINKQRKHLGISKSLKIALDREFKKYDKLILLEDDCIPFKFFFSIYG